MAEKKRKNKKSYCVSVKTTCGELAKAGVEMAGVIEFKVLPDDVNKYRETICEAFLNDIRNGFYTIGLAVPKSR